MEERVRKLEEGIIPIKSNQEINTEVKLPSSSRVTHKKEIAVEEKLNIPQEQEKLNMEIEKEEIIETKEISNNTDGYELLLDRIIQEWQKVLQNIKTKKINLYALLLEGELLTFENNMLTIGYKEGYGFHREAINTPQNKIIVEEIITKYFNREISVSFIIKDNLMNINRDNKKEEAIKKVIDFFGEDLVEIK